MIGYIEAATGIGLVVGPIIGSSVYSQLGFSGAFYFCGSLIVLFAVVSTFFHSKSKGITSERQHLLTDETLNN
jgi:MFS family permease